MPRSADNRGAAAVQLRYSGASFEDIAEVLGISSGRAAQRIVEDELAEHLDNPKQRRLAMRGQMNERLHEMFDALTSKVTDPEHPEQIAAIRAATALVDRFSRLNGLDEPTEVAIRTPTETELEGWVTAIVNEGMPQTVEADIVGELTA